MRVFYLFLIVMILGSCCISCSKDNDSSVVYNVEEEFSIGMKEGFAPDSSTLSLVLDGLLGYDCSNLSVDYDLEVGADRVTLMVEGMDTLHDCPESGNYYVNIEIPLGTLPQGYYDFHIHLGNTILNEGALAVSEKSYEAIFKDELRGIQFPEPRLGKMPKNTIWGRFASDKDIVWDTYQELVTLLQGRGCTPATLPTGYYSDFSILPSEDSPIIIWHRQNNHDYEYSFILQNTRSDFQWLESMLQNFNGDNDHYDYDYEIRTSTGLVFGL